MTMASMHEFRIGEVIGKGFQVLFRNLGAFAVISLLLTLPLLLFELITTNEMVALASLSSDQVQSVSPEQVREVLWRIFGYSFAAMAIQVVFSGIASGALTYGAVQDLRGRRAGFGECLGRGLALILPVIGVSIVAGFLATLGALLFVIPGIILLLMWWVAVPATVIERPGIFASLKRSSVLTKGSRWRILGMLLIVGVISGLLTFAVEILGIASTGLAFKTFLGWLVNAFVTALSAVLAAVSYYQLRVVKEGAEIDDIARVFD